MKKIIMQLDELSCPSCLQKIQRAVEAEPGVDSVKVLFNAGKVKANFDEGQTSSEQLFDAVKNQGYEVLSVKVREV
ncbi:heavy-metal-associated domain-containing protein [Levilactobacillus bambusae]|uniref:HMA domain-containing protein n=1 Tax=Levilactobacillus bambusae TaxID=2024736 RepID=A0A2V1N1C7_9LACO|nr:heavy-metal-associated domain-containing protein [Levilactobacillus bambusae]PWG00882.1 hypothetical protein DCM90_01535 [Levilactobacillus bambusae]